MDLCAKRCRRRISTAGRVELAQREAEHPLAFDAPDAKDSRDRTAIAAQIAVNSDGMVAVSVDNLAAALGLRRDFVEGQAAGGRVRVETDGQPVSSWFVPAQFGASSTVQFYGQAPTSIFDRERVYRLFLSSGLVASIDEAPVAEGGGASWSGDPSFREGRACRDDGFGRSRGGLLVLVRSHRQ